MVHVKIGRQRSRKGAPPVPDLPDAARPQRLDVANIPEDDVEVYRQLECPHYDLCLDHTIVKDWLNFTCQSCPLSRVVEIAGYSATTP